ncbi:hypothetical protein POTOM_010281 [Populus tomentosa]|uniref:Uncharacterized protein n=1 Tax=Populus tomentosa TaxID=118781 RepID=A0A8X8DA70_POPTO|nr:hypothetical protein POTOM_010281 [Populus tomentosa]
MTNKTPDLNSNSKTSSLSIDPSCWFFSQTSMLMRLIWEQMLSIASAKLVICWPLWSDISAFLPSLTRPAPYNEGVNLALLSV